MDMVERVARVIAEAQGDNFADAFKNKERWVAKRGMSGGRFRDVNEPFQSDYIEAAKAAIRAVLEGLEPVAWAFRGPNGEFELHHCSSWPEPVPEGWTETPLYDLFAIKEAVK